MPSFKLIVAVASIAVLPAFGLAGTVAAQDRSDAQQTVTFKANDLRDPAKAYFVRARLHAAADNVCSSDIVDGPMTAMGDATCKEETFKDAMRQVRVANVIQVSRKDAAPAKQQAPDAEANAPLAMAEAPAQ